MRLPRAKIPREESGSYHHCFNRTPNGEFLFDDVDREVLRRIERQVARGCGILILAFAYLNNHYHELLFVPPLGPLSDAQLLEQYRALYPKPTAHRPQRIEVIEAMLKKNRSAARKWRKWMLKKCDISEYQKLVKQRFTAWYNRRHRRYGTLWAGRFGSVLVESGTALLAVMAYIDLNSVRAGIVADPKDFRFCGYAEAVAGNRQMQRAIMDVYGQDNWERVQAEYRTLLFAVGSKSKEDAASIAEEHYRRVVKEGGKLSIGTIAQCKVAYFTRSGVLGSQDFVARHMERVRRRTGMKLTRGPMRLVPTEWGEWASLRAVRRRLGELVLVA